jgi:hypothetical protein
MMRVYGVDDPGDIPFFTFALLAPFLLYYIYKIYFLNKENTMKRVKTKKLELNKTSIANLGDPIIDLDKVRGGDDTSKSDIQSQVSRYTPACYSGTC